MSTDTALVCGGGGALGAAVAAAFLARGDRVVSAERRPRPREDVERLRVEAVDLTVPDEVEALWERLAAAGELPRWLVNTVGGFRAATVADTDPGDYRFLERSTSPRRGGRAAQPRAASRRARRSSTSRRGRR